MAKTLTAVRNRGFRSCLGIVCTPVEAVEDGGRVLRVLRLPSQLLLSLECEIISRWKHFPDQPTKIILSGSLDSLVIAPSSFHHHCHHISFSSYSTRSIVHIHCSYRKSSIETETNSLALKVQVEVIQSSSECQ